MRPQHNRVHDFAGDDHNGDTLANVNTKITDATLGDAGDFCEDTFEAWEFIPIGDMLDTTYAPAALALYGDDTGKIGVREFLGTGAADSIVLVPWEVPNDYVSGFMFRVVGWIGDYTTPAAAEGVYFALCGRSIAMGESLTGAFGAARGSLLDDLNSEGCTALYDRFITGLSSDVAVTGIAANETAMLELRRDIDSATDTYEQPVGVSGIWIQYDRKPTGV